jgi:hypothetical protein
MTKLRLVCGCGGDIKQSLRVGIPKPELGNEKLKKPVIMTGFFYGRQEAVNLVSFSMILINSCDFKMS